MWYFSHAIHVYEAYIVFQTYLLWINHALSTHDSALAPTHSTNTECMSTFIQLLSVYCIRLPQLNLWAQIKTITTTKKDNSIYYCAFDQWHQIPSLFNFSHSLSFVWYALTFVTGSKSKSIPLKIEHMLLGFWVFRAQPPITESVTFDLIVACWNWSSDQRTLN